MTLPELHLTEWRPTKDTLHLFCQIVGKVRLKTTAPRNHWWNAPLYVDVRGLTTRRLHHNDTTFKIDFDFVSHALVVRTGDGREQSFGLVHGLSVSDFDAKLHRALNELGVDVKLKEQPFGVPMTTPFSLDHEHAAWDRDAIDTAPESSASFKRAADRSAGLFSRVSSSATGIVRRPSPRSCRSSSPSGCRRYGRRWKVLGSVGRVGRTPAHR